MHLSKSLISADEISLAVNTLGDRITKDYAGKTDSIIAVGLLKGSAIFLSDLVRAIGMEVQIEFMSVSSYGSGTVSSQDVRIQQDLDCSITGRHVLLVEDIVDTGNTFSKVLNMLEGRKPASLKTVALLDKPSRRKVPVPIDYCGFTIEDVFVCGYGLDFNQKFRNLPYIGVLSE